MEWRLQQTLFVNDIYPQNTKFLLNPITKNNCLDLVSYLSFSFLGTCAIAMHSKIFKCSFDNLLCHISTGIYFLMFLTELYFLMILTKLYLLDIPQWEWILLAHGVIAHIPIAHTEFNIIPDSSHPYSTHPSASNKRSILKNKIKKSISHLCNISIIYSSIPNRSMWTIEYIDSSGY